MSRTAQMALIVFGVCTAGTAVAQAEFWLAETSWPIFHANTRATASSEAVGPGEIRHVSSIPSQTARRLRRPYVSPWTVVGKPYADGSQPIYTTPNDGVAKYLLRGQELVAIDFLELDRRAVDFDWGILLLNNRLGVVTERRRNRFAVFGEVDDSPESPVEVEFRIPIDARQHGKLTAHFTLAFDGTLIALTDSNRLIAVNLSSRQVVSAFDLPDNSGTSFHNSFPIDDQGRVFLATQKSMLAIDWDGAQFQVAWQAPYDMRGPGCDETKEKQRRWREAMAVARGATCTGSGTTPTIVGDRESGVVIVVDGHAPNNNLVAFWQGVPPADWRPLSDANAASATLSAQIAGVLALPYSTPEGNGFTTENSPAARNNSIVVAQWAGFRPAESSPRGLQRVDWKPNARRLELVWANPNVHINGVPTIACQNDRDCRIYGMGRYHDGYQYRAIDLTSGETTSSVNLGLDKAVLDQGNNHAIAASGELVYSGRERMVIIR